MRSEWRASRFQGGVSPCECRAIHTGSVVDWRAARREAATTRLNVRYSSAIWSYLTGSTPGGRTIRKMVSDLQLLEYVLALRFVVKFSELALVSLALSPCSISVRNLRRTAATKYSEISFGTTKITRRLPVTAFCHFQSAGAMFGGKRKNDFRYSWKCGRCRFKKFVHFRTQRHNPTA